VHAEASNPGVLSGFEEVYVDGACENNGKPNAIAGYGIWFGHGDSRNVSEPLEGRIQTNQRAELMAAAVGAEVYAAINNASCLVTSYCVLQIYANAAVVKDVVMYSDSGYVVGTDML
jgi:ribonuclease HI